MLPLISSQVSADEAICQQIGLVEGKTQSLPRDRIDGTRRLSDERHRTARHRVETPGHGDGSLERG